VETKAPIALALSGWEAGASRQGRKTHVRKSEDLPTHRGLSAAVRGDGFRGEARRGVEPSSSADRPSVETIIASALRAGAGG
jgi:hypothetical protein